MNQTSITQSKSREQTLWVRFLWLTGILLATIFIAAIALIWSASNRANDAEVETGLMILESVLSSQITDLEVTGIEHAFWDDMVAQVEARFDPNWVENNIGLFVHETADVSLTLVFNEKDNLILYVKDGEQLPSTEFGNPILSLAETFQQIREGPVDPPVANSGFLQFQDQVYFASIVPISPEYPDSGYTGSDRSLLLFGRSVSPDLFMSYATDFSLTNLRSVSTQPETPSIALIDFNGETVGWVTWTPALPGQTWLTVMLPILTLTFITIGVIGLMLARMWQATLQRMTNQEQGIVKAMDDAIAANSAKSVFLANMSHELRTPLNAVIGFSNILKSEMFGPVGSPKYIEYVDDIHSTSNHLLEVIDAILDLAKIEAEQISLDEETCAVSELVRDTMRLVGPSWPDVVIERTIVPADLSVHGDRTKLIQILTNLLSNAAKASTKGQTVYVDAHRKEDGTLIISIRDNGPGIPESIMRTLFQPFHRSSDPYRQETTGIGLGLVISLRMAEIHGGTVYLDSVQGEGTEATLILPADRVIPDSSKNSSLLG